MGLGVERTSDRCLTLHLSFEQTLASSVIAVHLGSIDSTPNFSHSTSPRSLAILTRSMNTLMWSTQLHENCMQVLPRGRPQDGHSTSPRSLQATTTASITKWSSAIVRRIVISSVLCSKYISAASSTRTISRRLSISSLPLLASQYPAFKFPPLSKELCQLAPDIPKLL